MKNLLLCFFIVLLCVTLLFVGTGHIYASARPQSLRVCMGGQITQITAWEYAYRVLLYESDSCTHIEAKKALAVAACSLGLYFSVYGGRHSDFDLCDDGNCCVALYGGDISAINPNIANECRTAVEQTRGSVLTVNSRPVMALFCLCNGRGGADGGILGLSANPNSQPCTRHTAQKSITYNHILQKLDNQTEKGILQNSVLVYNKSKKCRFGIIGGQYLSIRELQELLDIKSDDFDLQFTENEIKITCYGADHGLGMSLCHASEMAHGGADYLQILNYFYCGATINKLY